MFKKSSPLIYVLLSCSFAQGQYERRYEQTIDKHLKWVINIYNSIPIDIDGQCDFNRLYFDDRQNPIIPLCTLEDSICVSLYDNGEKVPLIEEGKVNIYYETPLSVPMIVFRGKVEQGIFRFSGKDLQTPNATNYYERTVDFEDVFERKRAIPEKYRKRITKSFDEFVMFLNYQKPCN